MGVARRITRMNPLSYAEEKLKTTKIITANNTPEK